MSASRLLEPGDLDAAWFAKSLGLDVTEARLIEKSTGTTGRALFALKGGEGVPASVFVKLPPFDEEQRKLVEYTAMGITEARFYRDLADKMPVRVPKVWYADTDGKSYIMVLEDLIASGCRLTGYDDPDVEERCLAIIEELAKLHAQYWNSPRFAPGGDLDWMTGRGIGSGRRYVENAVKVLTGNLGDEANGPFSRMAEYYLPRAKEIVQLWINLPGTLIHGDSHIRNVFVDNANGGRTGFYDWAMVCYSPGPRELAYLLCMTLEPEARKRVERQYVNRYCELLSGYGIKLDPEEAWDQYRLYAVYAWVGACSTAGMGTKWQPKEVGMKSARATSIACEEIDCIGLLEKLLA